MARIARVGIVQMSMSESHEENLGKAGKFVAEAAAERADVVVLPELFDEGAWVADCDLDVIREARELFHFYRDRRPETYGPLSGRPAG